jgi:hypothetical protein
LKQVEPRLAVDGDQPLQLTVLFSSPIENARKCR